MERGGWLDRVRESMVGFWGLLAESIPGARALRKEGVFATVVPATPERSVLNSVIYADTDALLGSLDELAAAYEDAGVLAWTVWVPEDDLTAGRALSDAGHLLDAEPRAMGMALERAEAPAAVDVDLSRDCDLATVGKINDLAYGHSDGTFERTIAALPVSEVHSYGARVDDEAAAVLIAADVGEDTEVAWVATAEAARGRGLATALMRQSLWDARQRGQRTSTLQATKLGTPIYRRVGFEDFGALQMWERRKPASL